MEKALRVEGSSLFGCAAESTGKPVPTLRRIVMSSYFGSGSTRALFLDCLTGRWRQHVSSKRRNYLPVDTAGHSTRLESPSSQLCKPQISKLSQLLNCIQVRCNRRSD